MSYSRRQFLAEAALFAPGLGLLRPRLLQAARIAPAEKLPPVRQITRGPKFHWFGYYDKFQFSPDDRFVLANEVDFEHRSPSADDTIRIGMVDTQNNDEWIELGETRAWNWQQGCMLQWLPGSQKEIIWNDRARDRFVCHIMNVETGERRTLPHPVYTVSPDGKTGISPDFSRLNDCRPGYGYAGIADPRKEEPAPDDIGIWRVDLKSGERKMLISLADAARIPYTGEERMAFAPQATHWFNHLLFNTDGSRFFFLHRWRVGRGFGTRAFTVNPDGSHPFILDPYGHTSHFIWRDPQHVMAWSWHPTHQSRFYLYKDLTNQVEPVGPDVMTENGHNSYLPGTSGQWVLNDTYPDADRHQHPYLFHIPTSRKVPLGHFHSPKEYSGEWRCDTHPRSSRDGKTVCIDSPHHGGRQMYVIDISGLLDRDGDA
jgi:hypothetical protein